MGTLQTHCIRASRIALEDNSIESIEELTELNQRDLNLLYRSRSAGNIPDGDSDGKVLFFPGTWFAEPAAIAASMVWQGKIFNSEDGILVNKVFGFKAIRARVYRGKSWHDGRESVIVDYKSTSLVAGLVRDEIRQIGPKTYLGRAYMRTLLGPVFVLNFALQFN